jgi:hypothetical protein
MPNPFSEKVQAQAKDLGAQTNPLINQNIQVIERAVRGRDFYNNKTNGELGVRMAVNISATYVGQFCQEGYKNAYDLGKVQPLAPGQKNRLGQDKHVPRRTIVDQALTIATHCRESEIYFGAVELNGTGIRFYGDLCLVLNATALKPDTVVLECNSYDLIRPPNSLFDLSVRVPQSATTWSTELHCLAALKTMATRSITQRPLTVGQISECILEDEDYLEILKVGSFTVAEVQETRSAAADAAAENAIEERLRLGACPSVAELEWRKHRRAANRALASHRVRVRIVTSNGRVR